MHPNGVWAKTLTDELARAGLRHAVIAPGSRSTPLVLALAAHPDVADCSVIDERSAAFFALGLARATGAPAAVVTTSGTAAANLLPAVAEADRAGVPLLLLTADRPPELRDSGDSQSIDQVKLFGGFVRWFHQVAEPSLDPGRLAYLRSTACEAWARAAGAAGGGPPGPVHLNLPFRKPLEPTSDGPAEADPTDRSAEAEEGGRGNPDVNCAPWRRVLPPTGEPDPAAVEELALALANAHRPLVLAGALTLPDPDPLRAAVRRLVAALPLPVWAEATSSLRGVPGVVATADLLLGSERFRRDLQPERIDLVLRLGAAPLGWPLRRLSALVEGAGAEVWTIDRWGRRHDPGHAAAHTLAADPARTLDAVAAWLERNDPAGAGGADDRRKWLALHRSADRAAREALAEAASTDDGELFDGGVFPRLARRLPEDAALVVSSSMPLRELEAFFAGPFDGAGLAGPAGPVDVFVNRGANGIDGVTSTAAGIAEGRRVGFGDRAESRTVLVTGDVAFAHDLSGALAAGRPSGQGPGIRSSSDLTVVLVDNGGGAIFDHLPLARLPEHENTFERHFTTPPGVDFGAVARGLGWSYAAADASGGWPAFDRALDDALAARGGPPRLLHVTTDRVQAKALREALMERVGSAVDRALRSGAPEEARPEARRALAEPPTEQEPPILLLHGFTGSGSPTGSLAPLIRRLAAAGHRVVTVDLPGHGTAPVPEGGATIDTAIAAAIAALDRRGLDRAAWVGYSMGGRVALAVAIAHPERVASLALLSASAGIEGEAERAARRASDEELARSLETDGLAPFVDRWMAHPLFATQNRPDRHGGHRHLRRARAERMAGSARGYAASLRGMAQGAQPSLWERLGEVRARTLLLAGAEDEKYVEIVRRMAEALPSARVEIVPGAGHAVHVEAPEPVARAILASIDGLGGE